MSATCSLSAFAGFQVAIAWIGDHKEIMQGLAVFLGVVLLAAVYSLASAFVGLAISVVAAMLPFIAIAAAIAGVAAAVMWAYNNWSWFHDLINNTVEWLKTNVPPAWEAVRAAVATAITWIATNVVPKIQMVVEFVSQQFGNLVGWVRNHWGLIKETIHTVFDLIQNIVATVIDKVQAVIAVVTAIISGIWDRFGSGLWPSPKPRGTRSSRSSRPPSTSCEASSSWP